MIISATDALNLPRARLTDEEQETLLRAEALISAAVQDQFFGPPMTFPVPLAQVPLKVLWEMKRRAERTGWAMTITQVSPTEVAVTLDIGRIDRVMADRTTVRAQPRTETVPVQFMTNTGGELTVPTRSLRRVISLALFGDGAYWDHLPAYIRAHHALFPGYELRIHVDPAAMTRARYGRALARLHGASLVQLMDMPIRKGQGKCEKMLWRLAPTWDPSVDYVFCRDVDSLPTWRERLATEEFIARAETGQVDVHALADNVAHSGVMGGMCGFRAQALRKHWPRWQALVDAGGYSDERWDRHGTDQDLLNDIVAPKLRVFEHAIFAIADDGGVHVRRGPTIPGSTMFSTTISACDWVNDKTYPPAAEGSDRLIRYIGAADSYSIPDAIAHYDRLGPSDVMAKIRECEQ